MNNKITNPLLKQLISEISNKTAEGRITGVSWAIIEEAKKKKKVNEAEKDPADELLGGDKEGEKDAPKPEQPTAEKGAEPKKGAGVDAAKADKVGAEEVGGEEDVEKAQADATKAKAELEKAKAEKDQAEEELEKQSYIKLKSGSGVQFLLGKILNQAFKSNTIDALASEMVQKLNIKTADDVDAFEVDNTPSKALPGMANLIASMKAMATKQPESSANTEEPSA
jgi:hypothetical protein